MDNIIEAKELQIERKHFYVELRENDRGKFMRITEEAHVLLGLKPNIALSELIGDIKTGSTNHINERRWIRCHFSWQEGYGAFSVSHSHLDRVVKYIRSQPTHHRRKSFQREYLEFLERHHVPYDERYIFKPVE